MTWMAMHARLLPALNQKQKGSRSWSDRWGGSVSATQIKNGTWACLKTGQNN